MLLSVNVLKCSAFEQKRYLRSSQAYSQYNEIERMQNQADFFLRVHHANKIDIQDNTIIPSILHEKLNLDQIRDLCLAKENRRLIVVRMERTFYGDRQRDLEHINSFQQFCQDLHFKRILILGSEVPGLSVLYDSTAKTRNDVFRLSMPRSQASPFQRTVK
jgi:antitoxin component of MazEF toxin-antitoxin module